MFVELGASFGSRVVSACYRAQLAALRTHARDVSAHTSTHTRAAPRSAIGTFEPPSARCNSLIILPLFTQATLIFVILLSLGRNYLEPFSSGRSHVLALVPTGRARYTPVVHAVHAPYLPDRVSPCLTIKYLLAYYIRSQ